MSKKKLFTLFLLISVLSSIGIANANLSLSDSEQAMKNMGESLREVANLVIDGSEGEAIINSQSNVIAEVNGRKITSTEMTLKIQMYALTGKDANEAWDGMKLVAMEENFARENGFMPTESEIMDYARILREDVESMQESAEHVSALASGLGMSLDEYWYEYRVKYEIPTLMVRERILAYNAENNLPELNPLEAECIIIDSEFFQTKGISVNSIM